MSATSDLKLVRHSRRKGRVKGAVRGSTERPRLSVCRSLRNTSAQVIDDTTGRTLAQANSNEKALRETMKNGGNKAAAVAIGKLIAQRAQEKGVTQVAFDRAGHRYHGRVKALADAAREAGLKF